MTAVMERMRSPLATPLSPAVEAHEPPEARGIGRGEVRLLVSEGASVVDHTVFSDLGSHLDPGDALVVNTSATIPAAVDAVLPDGRAVRIHFSTELPGGFWLVEVRQPVGNTTVPFAADVAGAEVVLDGGAHLSLLDRFGDSQRLWLASPRFDVLPHLMRYGSPIRYRHAPDPWPLAAYQQIFGREPGSAEMPSAARPFTPELVVDLVSRGVTIVPILLHAGVSSLEAHELPYPERYRVPSSTAAHVNAVHAAGGRVIAVGTTVVRALETAVDPLGVVHPSSRVDRAGRHAATRCVRGRRAGHRLARARSHAPAHAGGDRRPARPRTGLRRGPREWLSVARVRRLAPPPPGAPV